MREFIQKRRDVFYHLILWLVTGTFSVRDTVLAYGVARGLSLSTYFILVQLVCFYGAYFTILRFKKKRSHIIFPVYVITFVLFLWLELNPLLPGYDLERLQGFDAWMLGPMWTFFFVYAIHLVNAMEARTMEKQMLILEKERLKHELQFLKARINPHFLFNALNNIYSLAFQNDPMAATTVTKLSNLMRYMLTECDKTRVPLSKDFWFISQYVEMQLIERRNEWNVDVYFEDVRSSCQIAPLVLINFVENAFKHSDLDSNPKGWISVSGFVEEEELIFTVANTCGNGARAGLERETGEGIVNSKRQLELNYPNKHSLQIDTKNGEFKVSLSIKLM
ncbi:histidine kinase (plasmid) [Fulvitalea axinellae]|uniref:Histidine kinase n=1 Tax=Fulvitalea axinellae TaxID=1182444 RepID=A0AAU9D690_9BACT|nr:histidine kinase [Fulvitalea axinellae]